MRYQFEFRPYRRRFARSLSTSHGIWEVREGIILRLTDKAGNVGWGEIAPLPWFGSETLPQALDFCQQLSPSVTTQTIFAIPDEYPACQFGFESAWEGSGKAEAKAPIFTYSGLLPAGAAALQAWQPLFQQGYRTFKWKIGVDAVKAELNIFAQLLQVLPPATRLRLDANGGLGWDEAKEWLQACDRALSVEFIEQPLAPNQLEAMQSLQEEYETAIALDESVSNLRQMRDCYQRGWGGIFTIKPAIAGSPKQLRQFCQTHKIDAVFSSVFETAIGRQAALNLAAELSHPSRAVGFGVNHWFAEDEETSRENVWNNL